MRRRTPLREYLELRRLKNHDLLPENMLYETDIPTAFCFRRICSIGKTHRRASHEQISLTEALDHLLNYLNVRGSHLRLENFAFMSKEFFRGLVLAMFRGEGDPSAQIVAADLFHVNCRTIYQSLKKFLPIKEEEEAKGGGDSIGTILLALENMLDEAAFPLLVVISSANLDGLICSVLWALVNLLKSTKLLLSDNRFSSLTCLNWVHRLMLVEYIVETLDLQLRSLSRLTHLLARKAQTVNLYMLEDLDFDCLFPIFTILSNVCGISNMAPGYESRLLGHFERFAEFLHHLLVYVSSERFQEALVLKFVASTVLPVCQQYSQALLNFPHIVTPTLLSDFSEYLRLLEKAAFPSQESMAVIACYTAALRLFSALSNTFISKQLPDFQLSCLDVVVITACSLRKRLDWSMFGEDILNEHMGMLREGLAELSRHSSQVSCSCPLTACIIWYIGWTASYNSTYFLMALIFKGCRVSSIH
uniref:Non-specific serine/threonine protein kinase n=1 Tax=Mesocestoides corti TaxID=53468 RepID=A0A5K3EJG1_MESCO